jgi:DNA-binding HxlR family transcriptional regulator
MDILGRRWSALIIEAIGRGNAGFAEISKFVGAVVDPMLARRLRELESDGMLTREVVDGRPIRVRYSLTVCGSELLPILRQINVWAHANNLVDLPDPQHPLGVL